MNPAIVVNGLSYQRAQSNTTQPPRPVFTDVSFSVPAGARVLVLGRNGSGKSTLMSIMAGRTTVSDVDTVRVLGLRPGWDPPVPGNLALVTGHWTEEVGECRVGDLLEKELHRKESFERERLDELYAALDVNPDWIFTELSDGQRRRVQLVFGLLKPTKVLFLDEVLNDLDVVRRAQLKEYLQRDTERRKTTVLMATHILAGWLDWCTHILYVRYRDTVELRRVDEIEELQEMIARNERSPLVRLAEGWMENERVPILDD